MSRRDKHDKLRKKARNKIITLWRRENGRCQYCNCLCFPIRFLMSIFGRENVLEGRTLKKEFRHSGLAIILAEGTRFTFEIATADHILDLTSPVSSDLNNLRLACYKCNHRRGKEKEQRLIRSNVIKSTS